MLLAPLCRGCRKRRYGRRYSQRNHTACRYVAFRVPCIKPAKEDSKGWISPTRLVVYNRMLNPEGGYPEWVPTAYTILLEVSGDLWKGGRAAEKQVAAMVASALAPHRKANASHLEPHDCFSLVRCCQCEEAPAAFSSPFPVMSILPVSLHDLECAGCAAVL